MNCRQIQSMLSEFLDNRLSARLTWEVDRHIAVCNSCARSLNELKQTVRLVADAPRFEVSDAFMQRLQDRLATAKSQAPRRAWLAGARDLLRPRMIPVWGAGLAACAVAIVMVNQSNGPIVAPPQIESGLARTARIQSVSLAAANPLGDPAAAALVAASPNENSESTQ